VDPFATDTAARPEPRGSFALPREPMPEREDTRGVGTPLDSGEEQWDEAQEADAPGEAATEEKRPEAREPAGGGRRGEPTYGRRRGRRN
jgi:hypothetical protein